MLFGLTIEIEKKEDIEVTVCDEYEPCACGHKGEYGEKEFTISLKE